MELTNEKIVNVKCICQSHSKTLLVHVVLWSLSWSYLYVYCNIH